jgi:hypothetical protein
VQLQAVDRGVWHGVSKGVMISTQAACPVGGHPLGAWVATPEAAIRSFQGWPPRRVLSGRAWRALASSNTLGSPWILLSIRGKIHDQGDAKWIIIKGQLRGHNNANPANIARPVVGRPQVVFGGLSFY